MEPALAVDQPKARPWLIHAVALAAGAVSLVLGEIAAVGGDAWFLRGLQAMLFTQLARKTKVPLGPSATFAVKEFCSPVVIGLACVRIGVSWLAIGGHVATGGDHVVMIAIGIRCFNAVLSVVITEKMGWGYLKRAARYFDEQAIEAIPPATAGSEAVTVDLAD